MELLRQCDTLVYDSLIDKRLLNFAPKNSEKICVGKRSGHHSESQERINEILVEKALSGRNVVRLKGGDPFIFGRGGEEILALREAEIQYQVVPGITSASAVPELAGIPVTHRRVSRSFHVITGHTVDAILPENLEKYAKLSGTLVFLMGLKNLPEIAEGLIASGMSGNTPAAVISNGAASHQRVIRSSLSSIAYKAQQEKIEAPAVIVIGETVNFDFSPTITRPLDRVTVTVTGTPHFTEKISGGLRNLGADVIAVPTLKITEYKDNPKLDDALENIGEYSWIVLTSINGAEIFLNRLRKLRIDMRRLANVKFAVIGSATAEILEQHGIFPDFVPKKFTSGNLGNELSECVNPDERVLILRAENGSPELTEILERRGKKFTEIKTYNACRAAEIPDNTVVSTDFITFSSASGVNAFFGAGCGISERTKVICIGEITARALAEYGVRDFSVSPVQTADGIINKIIQEVEMS
jgi:uroporphyrinogen III methyltransferase/synthase